MASRPHTPPVRSPRTALPRSLARGAASPAERVLGGGTSGNERLTAATGAVLFVLLAVLGVTIVRLRPLLSDAPVPRDAADRPRCC